MKRREFLGLAGAAILAPAVVKAQAASGTKLRVVIVANKAFEADPLIIAVGGNDSRNPNLLLAHDFVWPRSIPQADRDVVMRPRCLIDVGANNGKVATAEIWCLDDLIPKPDGPSKSDNKAKALAKLVATGAPPDGVIAFGTAGFPGDDSRNGCASFGGTVFIHDAKGSDSHWSWPGNMEKLVTSKIPASLFSDFISNGTVRSEIRDRLLRVPNNPALPAPDLIAAADGVAIASVNIGPPYDYETIDNEAIKGAKTAGAGTIVSVETTHGVIRAASPEAPFMFVTAIPNRVGKFREEAFKSYGQNFAASHNAGVVLSFLLPQFVNEIAKT